jgi:hypothetical protein
MNLLACFVALGTETLSLTWLVSVSVFLVWVVMHNCQLVCRSTLSPLCSCLGGPHAFGQERQTNKTPPKLQVWECHEMELVLFHTLTPAVDLHF